MPVCLCIASGALSSPKRERASGFAQQFQQSLGRLLHLVVSLLLQAQVDPVVFGDSRDIGFHPIAYVYGTENLIAVDHAQFSGGR